MMRTLKAGSGRSALVPLLALLAAGAGTACTESNDLTVPVLPTAVTVFRDPEFDFTTLHTFAMPDTLVHLVPLTAAAVAVTRDVDRVILAQVRADLISRGYVENRNPQTIRPDFIVLVGVAATTSYNAFAGYPWFSVWGFYTGWGWFTPGFTADWTIVYPWFGTVGNTSFEQGSVIVDIIPTSSVNSGARSIRAAWSGVASGLLRRGFPVVTVTAAVDRMFQLSPYLTAPPAQ